MNEVDTLRPRALAAFCACCATATEPDSNSAVNIICPDRIPAIFLYDIQRRLRQSGEDQLPVLVTHGAKDENMNLIAAGYTAKMTPSAKLSV